MGESKRRVKRPKNPIHKQSKRLLYLWDDVVPFTKLNPLFVFLILLLLPSFLSFFFLSLSESLKKIIIIVYLFIRDSDLLFSLSIDGGHPFFILSLLYSFSTDYSYTSHLPFSPGAILFSYKASYSSLSCFKN